MFQKLDFQSVSELSQKQDLYERLGVKPDATPEDIYAAATKLLAAVHPYRNQERRDAAVQATHLIREAFDTLSNTESRRAYDQQRHPEAQGIDWADELRVLPTAKAESLSSGRFAAEIQLKQRNITPTKEGIIQWLENTPTTTNSIELLTVLWASKALGLFTPEDIRNDTGVPGAFNARFLSGIHYPAPTQSAAASSTAPNSEPTTDPAHKQKTSALQSLARLLDDQPSFRYSFGVSERYADHFRSRKNEFITKGILAASDIEQSPEIRAATLALSISFEERLRSIQEGHLLHDATKAFVNFIEEHALTIPDEIRQTLLASYTKNLEECIKAEPVRFFYGVGYDRDQDKGINDLKSRLGPQPIRWI